MKYGQMGRKHNNCKMNNAKMTFLYLHAKTDEKNTRLEIDFSTLPSGIYFLRVGNETKMFVKEK